MVLSVNETVHNFVVNVYTEMNFAVLLPFDKLHLWHISMMYVNLLSKRIYYLPCVIPRKSVLYVELNNPFEARSIASRSKPCTGSIGCFWRGNLQTVNS